jgi:polyhydroxyalkanoate synthesis regulator protein
MTMTTKSPRLFVRYRNRKLHEIGDGNPYTTMEELLEIASTGVQVKVTDDETGKDLTAFTLSRLVYDRSRMDHGAFKVSDLLKLLMSAPLSKAKAA